MNNKSRLQEERIAVMVGAFNWGIWMTDDSSFSRLVLGLAWKNTLSFLKSWLHDSLVGIVALIVGTFLFSAFGRTSDPLASQIVAFLAYTSAPTGLILVGIFIWHLGLAPLELIYISSHPSSSTKPRTFARVTPNYEIWKARAVYTVDELAALLDAHEPKWSARSPKAQALIDLILEQIRLKKLAYIVEYGVTLYTDEKYQLDISSDTKIKKIDAIAWAELNNIDVSKLK